MPTIADGRVPAAESVTPICIFSALIDGLTDQERYTLEVRNGELHIQPAPRRRQANARVVPTARAA